jgi:hypothetical protein
MMTDGGSEVKLQTFLTPTGLLDGELSAPDFGPFTFTERALGIHWKEDGSVSAGNQTAVLDTAYTLGFS